MTLCHTLPTFLSLIVTHSQLSVHMFPLKLLPGTSGLQLNHGSVLRKSQPYVLAHGINLLSLLVISMNELHHINAIFHTPFLACRLILQLLQEVGA